MHSLDLKFHRLGFFLRTPCYLPQSITHLNAWTEHIDDFDVILRHLYKLEYICVRNVLQDRPNDINSVLKWHPTIKALNWLENSPELRVVDFGSCRVEKWEEVIRMKGKINEEKMRWQGTMEQIRCIQNSA